MVNILLLVPYLAYGDLFAIHGGVVSNGRNNILITSSSLGGKTTFSLLFLENNWQIITEETTYITKRGELLDYPVRNYFNIRIGTYLEFKDLFIKKGIINKKFLSISKRNKNNLFDLGKNQQISIDFEILCKNKSKLRNKQITHVLNISLKKDIENMIIRKIKLTEIINKFLEMSNAPTTMLFRNLMKIENLKIRKTKKNLKKILQKVKCYSVISGLNYRKNFNYLLNKIEIK
jgi:guanylate kinase